jgi:hypothetical protein
MHLVRRDQKFKRILIVFSALAKHGLDPDVCLEFMEYVFHLEKVYLTRIIKNYKLEDFKDEKLPHLDIDMKMVDNYVLKLYTNAKKGRSKVK